MTIKLLHVEDDTDILEIALLALEMSGEFSVEQFTDGARAIARATQFAPDVFLLDMMMPGMTGVQVLAALREIPQFADTPAIFMTARAQPAERREMIDQGAKDVIVKPFDPMTLPQQIKDILARNND